MSRSSILIILGIFIVLVPFSGLPIEIRTLFAVVFGTCVFGIGLSMRSRETHRVQSRVEIPPPATPPHDVFPI